MKDLPAKRKPRGVIELLANLQSGAVEPRVVTTEERRMCVSYLRLEGYTQDEMAKIFGVHRATISRDEKVLLERAGKMLAGLNPQSVAGGLIAWARHVTAKAMKEKDHRLVWKVQRELVVGLQQLGCLPTAPTEWRGELRHGLDVNLENLPTYRELKGQVDQLSVLGEAPEEVARLRDAIERSCLDAEVRRLTDHQDDEGPAEEVTADDDRS